MPNSFRIIATFFISTLLSSWSFAGDGYWQLASQSPFYAAGSPADQCPNITFGLPWYSQAHANAPDQFQCYYWVITENPCEDEVENTNWNQETFACEPPEPPPPGCEIPAGTIQNFTFSGYSSTSICSSDCKFLAAGIRVFSGDAVGYGSFQSTGGNCDGTEGGNTPPEPPDPGDPPPPPDDPDDGCPVGYNMTGAGCALITPPEPDGPGDCPANYFADANGNCWHDPTGAEGGNNPDAGGSTGGGSTGGGPNGSEPNTGAGNDQDGDGTPDASDADIDGDGVPNGTDNDRDGDGVPNADDIDPDGEDPEGTATDCELRPSSSGDAQLSAIHLQLWINQCSSGDEEISDLTDCNSIFTCKSDPISCEIAKREWTSSCSLEQGLASTESDAQGYFEGNGYEDLESYESGGLLDDLTASQGVSDIEINNEVGDFFSISSSSASCPAPQQVNLGQFGTVEFSLQLICDLAAIIYYIVMLGAYFFGGNIVLRSLTD
ncbi:virulence factor TspB C-terminal domain-related protein [Porticoccaceae bacterium]|nr:virulence factor TspB C-terminal domain-related protein [Porticoccaceae bacterium]